MKLLTQLIAKRKEPSAAPNLKEKVFFVDLAAPGHPEAWPRYSNLVDNIRKDCSTYSKLLVFYLVIAVFTVGAAIAVSDKAILLGEYLNFPILQVDVPVSLVLVIFPSLQAMMHLALCRSAMRIQLVAKALSETIADERGDSQPARLDFGLAAPSLLLPPASYLLQPFDRIVTDFVLNATMLAVLASSSWTLSAFGVSGQHYFLCLIVGVYGVSLTTLYKVNRNPKASARVPLSLIIFFLTCFIVIVGTIHASHFGTTHSAAKEDSESWLSAQRLVRHATFANEVLQGNSKPSEQVIQTLRNCTNVPSIDGRPRLDRLEGEKLHNSDFTNSIIAGFELAEIDLSFADFSGATLFDVDFRLANLNHANFSRACLVDVSFSEETTLTGASFNNAQLFNTRFIVTQLEGVTFTNSFLKNVKFDNIDAKDAKFMDSQWYDVVFRNSEAYQADFSSSLLYKVRFDRVKLNKTTWNFTDIVESRFRESDLIDSRWKNNTLITAKVVGGNMSLAEMKKIYVRNLSLAPTSFDKGSVELARFESTHVEIDSTRSNSFDLKAPATSDPWQADFFERETHRHKLRFDKHFLNSSGFKDFQRPSEQHSTANYLEIDGKLRLIKSGVVYSTSNGP